MATCGASPATGLADTERPEAGKALRTTRSGGGSYRRAAVRAMGAAPSSPSPSGQAPGCTPSTSVYFYVHISIYTLTAHAFTSKKKGFHGGLIWVR